MSNLFEVLSEIEGLSKEILAQSMVRYIAAQLNSEEFMFRIMPEIRGRVGMNTTDEVIIETYVREAMKNTTDLDVYLLERVLNRPILIVDENNHQNNRFPVLNEKSLERESIRLQFNGQEYVQQELLEDPTETQTIASENTLRIEQKIVKDNKDKKNVWEEISRLQHEGERDRIIQAERNAQLQEENKRLREEGRKEKLRSFQGLINELEAQSASLVNNEEYITNFKKFSQSNFSQEHLKNKYHKISNDSASLFKFLKYIYSILDESIIIDLNLDQDIIYNQKWFEKLEGFLNKINDLSDFTENFSVDVGEAFNTHLSELEQLITNTKLFFESLFSKENSRKIFDELVSQNSGHFLRISNFIQKLDFNPKMVSKDIPSEFALCLFESLDKNLVRIENYVNKLDAAALRAVYHKIFSDIKLTRAKERLLGNSKHSMNDEGYYFSVMPHGQGMRDDWLDSESGKNSILDSQVRLPAALKKLLSRIILGYAYGLVNLDVKFNARRVNYADEGCLWDFTMDFYFFVEVDGEKELFFGYNLFPSQHPHYTENSMPLYTLWNAVRYQDERMHQSREFLLKPAFIDALIKKIDDKLSNFFEKNNKVVDEIKNLLKEEKPKSDFEKIKYRLKFLDPSVNMDFDYDKECVQDIADFIKSYEQGKLTQEVLDNTKSLLSEDLIVRAGSALKIPLSQKIIWHFLGRPNDYSLGELRMRLPALTERHLVMQKLQFALNQVKNKRGVVKDVYEIAQKLINSPLIEVDQNDNKKNYDFSKSIISRIHPNGLIFQGVPGDGHCFYHAMALHLGIGYDGLRNIIADHMEAHPEEFQDFTLREGRTYEQYLEDVRKDAGQFAQNPEIEALMRILSRRIMIVLPNGRLNNPNDALRFTGEPPIFVAFTGEQGGLHYDAYLYSNTPPEIVLENILRQHHPEVYQQYIQQRLLPEAREAFETLRGRNSVLLNSVSEFNNVVQRRTNFQENLNRLHRVHGQMDENGLSALQKASRENRDIQDSGHQIKLDMNQFASNLGFKEEDLKKEDLAVPAQFESEIVRERAFVPGNGLGNVAALTIFDILERSDNAPLDVENFLRQKGDLIKQILSERNTQGETALHMAALRGDSDLIRVLLSYGANLLEKFDNRPVVDLVPTDAFSARALLNTHIHLQQQQRQLGYSLSRLTELLKEGLARMRDYRHENSPAVLLVGETRVGKSTLTNFLHGTDYQIIEGELGTEARRMGGAEEVVKTSNANISETLYPTIIDCQFPSGHHYGVVDMAGVHDTRGDAESVCADQCMQLIAEKFNKVNLVACVSTENHVRELGKMSLRKTLANVGRMMMQNNLDNTMLVVTQSFVENDRLEIRENQLYNILRGWRDQEFAQPIVGEGIDVDERKAIQYALNIICRDPSGVAIIRASHPEDRLRFESRLNAMEVVHKNEYNFAHFNRNQEHFSVFIDHVRSYIDNLRKQELEIVAAMNNHMRAQLPAIVQLQQVNLDPIREHGEFEHLNRVLEAQQQLRSRLENLHGQMQNIFAQNNQVGFVGDVRAIEQNLYVLVREYQENQDLFGGLNELLLNMGQNSLFHQAAVNDNPGQVRRGPNGNGPGFFDHANPGRNNVGHQNQPRLE